MREGRGEDWEAERFAGQRFLCGGKEPGTLQPGAEAFSKALPWSEGLAFFLFSFSHGLVSPVPSLPGAVSAPSPVQDGTAQGTWWEPRPGSSPCPAAQLAALGGPSKAPAHRGSFPWAESGVQGFGRSCCPSALLPVRPRSPAQVWSTFVGEDASPACHTEIHVPILGQLLGHLILCHARKSWEISWVALDALHHLFRFILQQKCKRSCGGPHPSTHISSYACLFPWLLQ